MGEVTALRKLQAVVIAAFVTVALGFGLSMSAQPAYADELQASGIDLSAQSQKPVVSTVATKTMWPGKTITVTFKDKTDGQTGTWKVTSSNKSVVKATKSSSTNKQVKVKINAVKAGTATVKATYTTKNGKKGTNTVKIKVTGLKKGANYSALVYEEKVLTNSGTTGTLAITGVCKYRQNKTSYAIPNTKTINGRKYTVTQVNAKALTGLKDAKWVKIGKNVKKLGARMVAGDKKLKTVIIATTKLTKANVKNCLKGSSVTKVKVPKAQLAKYKKFFTKANCGKKVTVVAA